jgi:hypothetical protein
MGTMSTYFLVGSIFECLDNDLSVRTCDLQPNRSTLILIASAMSSWAMLGFKYAHAERANACMPTHPPPIFARPGQLLYRSDSRHGSLLQSRASRGNLFEIVLSRHEKCHITLPCGLWGWGGLLGLFFLSGSLCGSRGRGAWPDSDFTVNFPKR